MARFSCFGINLRTVDSSEKMLQANIQNWSSIYSMWRCTPVYNLTHLAPQENFSLMPNCCLGPPEHETKTVLKNKLIWATSNAWLPWQPMLRFLQMSGGGGGAVHTNSIIS